MALRELQTAYQNPGRMLTTALLDDDLLKATGAMDAKASIEDKILALEATPDEVVEWHFAQDPLMEDMAEWLRLEHASRSLHFTRAIEDRFRRRVELSVRAGLTLMHSVIYPDAFSGSANWFDSVWDWNLGRSNGSSEPYAFENEVPVPVDTNGLQRLLWAAEMMEEASSYESHRDAHHPAHNSASIDYRAYGHSLNRKVFELSCEPGRGIEDRMLGLRGLWSLGADLTGAGMKDRQSENDFLDTGKMLGTMVGTLEGIYVGDGQLLYSGASVRDKGRLHEQLWFLDSLIYMRTQGIQDIAVRPSASNQDRPAIGYPYANRAFDIWVGRTDKSAFALLQLKSKPNPDFKQTYHPSITSVHEKNFKDAEPKRLKRKLGAYSDYISSGFDPSAAGPVENYVLPSVKHSLDNLESLDSAWRARVIHAAAISKIIHPGRPALNRRMRRLLARH